MNKAARSGGLVLVGDVYWKRTPPPGLAESYGQEFASLGGTLEIFEKAGVDLVEMVLASLDDWDRYAASQWLNVSDWLAANPEDPEADDVRRTRDEARRSYMNEQRASMVWGVFVGRLEG